MPDEKTLGGEVGSVSQENIPEKQGGSSAGAFSEQGGETRIEETRERIEGKYNEILSKVIPQVTGTSQSSDDHELDVQSIGATVDEESKIQKLIDLATAKGVFYAVKVARTIGDYYALDRMHDELVDKLYEGLLTKGLITKE